MNPNVRLPKRVRISPWTGVDVVPITSLFPGDVVISRSSACGACTVTSFHEMESAKGELYVVFYCCGGQWYKLSESLVVAYPRLSSLPGGYTPQHPLDACDFSKKRFH